MEARHDNRPSARRDGYNRRCSDTDQPSTSASRRPRRSTAATGKGPPRVRRSLDLADEQVQWPAGSTPRLRHRRRLRTAAFMEGQRPASTAWRPSPDRAVEWIRKQDGAWSSLSMAPAPAVRRAGMVIGTHRRGRAADSRKQATTHEGSREYTAAAAPTDEPAEHDARRLRPVSERRRQGQAGVPVRTGQFDDTSSSNLHTADAR